eukprot:3944951-Amphidinium_carterae.1
MRELCNGGFGGFNKCQAKRRQCVHKSTINTSQLRLSNTVCNIPCQYHHDYPSVLKFGFVPSPVNQSTHTHVHAQLLTVEGSSISTME